MIIITFCTNIYLKGYKSFLYGGLHLTYFHPYYLRLLQLSLLLIVLNLFYPFLFPFLSLRVILIACT